MTITTNVTAHIQLTPWMSPRDLNASPPPPVLPWWPSECWCRSLGCSSAGCWSDPSPAPALCSCSAYSLWGTAALPPRCRSPGAAWSRHRPPLQTPCHLRTWHRLPRNGTDQKEAKGGLVAVSGIMFQIGLLVIIAMLSCFWVVNSSVLFFLELHFIHAILSLITP